MSFLPLQRARCVGGCGISFALRHAFLTRFRHSKTTERHYARTATTISTRIHLPVLAKCLLLPFKFQPDPCEGCQAKRETVWAPLVPLVTNILAESAQC